MSNTRDIVLTNLVALFKTITTSNGYLTNIGNNVDRGFMVWNQIPADQFPHLYVHASRERIEHFATSQKQSFLEIDVYGYIKGTIHENLDIDTQALAEDIIKAIGSNERLFNASVNVGYVDFPDDFEISSWIIEPFGLIHLPLTYIYERNERGQGYVARRWWVNNVSTGSHNFGSGIFSSITSLTNTPYVQFTELFDRIAVMKDLTSSGFTIVDSGIGNAETLKCLIYVEENL